MLYPIDNFFEKARELLNNLKDEDIDILINYKDVNLDNIESWSIKRYINFGDFSFEIKVKGKNHGVKFFLEFDKMSNIEDITSAFLFIQTCADIGQFFLINTPTSDGTSFKIKESKEKYRIMFSKYYDLNLDIGYEAESEKNKDKALAIFKVLFSNRLDMGKHILKYLKIKMDDLE